MVKQLRPIIVAALIIGVNMITTVAQSDDNAIVFVSTREGYRDIYWMTVDEREVTHLTNDAAQDLHPAWSPDRSQIAFVSDRDGSYAIYVMNADGSAVRRVVGGDGGYYEFPTWSPDGRNLVYSSDVAGSFDLYRVTLGGDQVQRLTTSDEDESDPSWSPDGSQIAYLQSLDGVNQIYLINATGGSPQPMIPGGGSDFAAPRWSPNGGFLAYAAMTYDDIGNIAELYIYDLRAGEERLLTSLEDGFITGISWSRDSEALVYTQRAARGGAALYQICVDGDCASVLTEANDNSEFPSWSTPPLVSGVSIARPLGTPSGSCPNLLESRLVIGELARVLPDQVVNIRHSPTTSAERLASMPAGRLFEVRGGPFCTDGYAWWEVYHNQRVGYAAESGEGEYWLEPIGFLSQPRPIPNASRSIDTIQYAYQPFENGFMFWIRSTNQIFVLVDGDIWRVFPDFFVEGEQETDPSYQPPRGLLQPRRGFGKVWRDNPTLRDQVGWATYREVGYDNRFEYDPATGTIVLYDPVGRPFTLDARGIWRRG